MSALITVGLIWLAVVLLVLGCYVLEWLLTTPPPASGLSDRDREMLADFDRQAARSADRR